MMQQYYKTCIMNIFIIFVKSCPLQFYLITFGKVRGGQRISLVIVFLVSYMPLVADSITMNILILTLLDYLKGT